MPRRPSFASLLWIIATVGPAALALFSFNRCFNAEVWYRTYSLNAQMAGGYAILSCFHHPTDRSPFVVQAWRAPLAPLDTGGRVEDQTDILSEHRIAFAGFGLGIRGEWYRTYDGDPTEYSGYLDSTEGNGKPRHEWVGCNAGIWAPAWGFLAAGFLRFLFLRRRKAERDEEGEGPRSEAGPQPSLPLPARGNPAQ